ncbi:MAG TPA: transporter associated domain-containing protein, partial [Pirellulales bacterium]
SELRLAPDQPSLRGIMRSMPDLSDELSIASSLQRMIREHVHIALVRNRQGEIVGMVTMEDILEELVGDIEDEYDRVPGHVSEVGVGWVMGGGVNLDRVERIVGVSIDRSDLPPDCRTLHDWIVARLKRPVRGGDVVKSDGLRVLVRKLRRQRVLEAQVSREAAVAGHETEGAPQPVQPPAREAVENT